MPKANKTEILRKLQSHIYIYTVTCQIITFSLYISQSLSEVSFDLFRFLIAANTTPHLPLLKSKFRSQWKYIRFYWTSLYIIYLVNVDHFGVFNVNCIFSSFLLYIQKLPGIVRKPVSIFPNPIIFLHQNHFYTSTYTQDFIPFIHTSSIYCSPLIP